MGMEEGCSTQLIDGEGNFNKTGLDKCVKAMKLADQALSYAVVSIMGPQSSGKSTLLNNLFHTNFREMDAFRGRTQTTQGIWIERATGIDPCTLIMDLEGTDGRERGEDDTAFEKQSALFALAVSDIVLINMWCHDIGREQAANKPPLKTVFQVRMRLFSPRKTTLLFVIRDKTKTLEVLEPVLREDIQKIWDSVSKPPAHKQTPYSEFFNVEVTALSSYKEKEEQFKEQVMLLRKRFFNSIAPGGLAGDRRAVVPASGFPFSTQQIWKIIRENKDLDLPAHKVVFATVPFEEIANENLAKLASDEDWLSLELEEAEQSGRVLGFGKKISSILDKFISEICAGCNKEIGDGEFLNLKKDVWHPQCFCCQSCGQTISEHFSMQGNDPYHRSCFKELYNPKCDVCNDFLPTNRDRLILYIGHRIWGLRYCLSHEDDNTPQCCSCERMEPRNVQYISLRDGRKLCGDCSDSKIMDINEFQRLCTEIRDFYEGMNMRISQRIPMRLVERETLNETMQGEEEGSHMLDTRGLCLPKKQTVMIIARRLRIGGMRARRPRIGGDRIIGRFTRRHVVADILILCGLPRLLTGSILVHELMHAWLLLNGFPTFSPDVEEGICQVLTYMWLESELMAGSQFEKKLGYFFMDQIATTSSPEYGDGFRVGYAAMLQYGLKGTLDHIRRTRSFP